MMISPEVVELVGTALRYGELLVYALRKGELWVLPCGMVVCT